MKIIPETRRTH